MSKVGNVEEKAVELLDRLDNLVTQYAPEVYDTAVEVVRMSGLTEIVWGVFGICFVIVAFFIVKWLWRVTQRDEVATDIETGFIVLGCVLTLVLIFGGIIHLGNLLHLWNWVAVFDPELALARKVLHL